MRFLELALEDDVTDHSILSRFRTALTKANAWDGLLKEMNRQIESLNVTLSSGCHVDASITHSPRKPKTKPTYEIVIDRNESDDESEAQADMKVIEVRQPGVDAEARWTKKGGKTLFGYKQHTLVDDNGLVIAVETTAANRHDSQRHREALKERGLKNGIQDKAVRNKPLTKRQLQRNRKITQVRYVVERTFGSQERWFGSKILRYVGLDKAHAWHVLQAMAYNLKRLPVLYVKSGRIQPSCAF